MDNLQFLRQPIITALSHEADNERMTMSSRCLVIITDKSDESRLLAGLKGDAKLIVVADDG